MALNIDGTTGISGVDGSASAASIAGTDSNTGLSFGSDAVNVNTGGSARLQLTNSGMTSNVNTTINNVTGGNGLTVNLADATTDNVQINGGANQSRTIVRVQQGNTDGSSSTGYRIARSDGTDTLSLEVSNHHNYIDFINLKKSGHIRFFTSSSENNDGTQQRVVINSRGSLQGSGDGHSRPAFAFTNDTDSGMYRRGSNNIGFATAGNERYFMGNSALGPVQDNAKDLGTGSNRWDDVRATNGNILTSDKNEKNTITASDLGLNFVNKLTPVSYKFNKSKDGKAGSRTHYGLIAQDIETLLGTLGKSTTDFAGFCKDTLTTDENDKPLETPVDRYGLRYTEFMAPMIKAIQELSAEVNTLKTKVAALEAA